MNPSIVRACLAGSAAIFLLVSRSLPFATGIPMVGEVALATPGEGGSGLSWAGDGRVFTSVALLLLAAAASAAGWANPARWLAGLSAGWIAAFVHGAALWHSDTKRMLKAMSIDPGGIEISLPFGFYAWVSAVALTVAFSIWALVAPGSQPCEGKGR